MVEQKQVLCLVTKLVPALPCLALLKLYEQLCQSVHQSKVLLCYLGTDSLCVYGLLMPSVLCAGLGRCAYQCAEAGSEKA